MTIQNGILKAGSWRKKSRNHCRAVGNGGRTFKQKSLNKVFKQNARDNRNSGYDYCTQPEKVKSREHSRN